MSHRSNVFHALLLAVLSAAPLHAATTHTWPGAAPCAGTLQACIDAASDGDRIEIATDGPAASSATVAVGSEPAVGKPDVASRAT